MRNRRAFTVLEVTVAIGLLTLALVLAAQVGVWSLGDRRRSTLREEALEAAANVLETAQAADWESVTPAWAAAQRLPEALGRRLPKGKLTVRVEPEKARPLTKRVTVVIDWRLAGGTPARAVVLVGLFSARSAKPGGEGS